jgi:hypothetical protein
MSLRNYLKGIADALRTNGIGSGLINAQEFADNIYYLAENKYSAGIAEGYQQGYLDASPQETVSGEAICITDALPIEHNMGVSVRGKNLIPYPYPLTSGIYKDVEVVVNDDGTIVLNGTASGISYLTISNKDFGTKDMYSGYGTNGVFMSGCPEGVNPNLYFNAKNKITSFTITKGKTYNNYIIKPMVEVGTTATSYAPYIEDISTVKLLKQGKNLADSSLHLGGAIKADTYTEITYKLNSVLPANIPLRVKLFFEDGTKLDTSYQLIIRQRPYYQEGELLIDGTNKAVTLTEEETTKAKYVYIYVNATGGATYGGKVPIGLMITLYTPTEYEPYIEPTIYDVQADGIVEGVKSLYPNTTLYTDTSGAVIDCTYYQDGKKVKENLIDMILELGGVINE